MAAVASADDEAFSQARESALRDNVQQLIDMLLAGKALDAFERFYAENCVMSENGEDERVGKSACRAHEREFVQSIDRWNDIRIGGVLVEGNKAAIEIIMDIAFVGGKRVVRRQLIISTWSKGKIVHSVAYHA